MNKQLFSLAFFALLLSLFAEKATAQASGINPQLYMYRHNGTLDNTPNPVLPGNTIGTLEWRGLTAMNAIRLGATIKSIAKSVSPGALSANMIFSTSGAAGLSDRAIITETGLFGIGIMNPLYHLDVAGNTHTSGRFFGRIHFDTGEPTNLPSSYNDEAYFERKSRIQLGLGANSYANGGILSLAPGAGSLDRQLFSGGDDGLLTRSQNLAGTDTWSAWEKILTSGDINGRPNLVARFLPPGPLSSKLSDGQVFDNGSNVVIGGIPASPAIPAPVFNAADILTVKGNIRNEGSFRSTGNAKVDGDAIVTGVTNTGNLDVIGSAIVGNSTTTKTLIVTSNATVSNNTTTNSLNVSSNATVANNTTTNSLNVGSNATVGNNTTTNSLNVGSNATVNGNLGIGKSPTTFNLDVAGQSNFDGRVKIGAVSFPTATSYQLAVGGGVIAEEVLVQLESAWADYVFDKGYELKPLSEVERFITAEKHLPGVVSAKEVADTGLNLGQMQKAQMEKIEELYLHLIEMDKQLTSLKAENTALKAKFEQLEQRN